MLVSIFLFSFFDFWGYFRLRINNFSLPIGEYFNLETGRGIASKMAGVQLIARTDDWLLEIRHCWFSLRLQ